MFFWYYSLGRRSVALAGCVPMLSPFAAGLPTHWVRWGSLSRRDLCGQGVVSDSLGPCWRLSLNEKAQGM